VLLEEEHSLGEDELHCMMERGDDHLRTEEEYFQKMVNKATWHYVEHEVGCLGLGCYMDSWCWELAEDEQEASEVGSVHQVAHDSVVEM